MRMNGGDERRVGGGGRDGGVLVRAERELDEASESVRRVLHEVNGLVDGCSRWVRLAMVSLTEGDLGPEGTARVESMLGSALRGLERLSSVAGRGMGLGLGEVGGTRGLYGSEPLPRVLDAVMEQLGPMCRERGVRVEPWMGVGVLGVGPMPLFGVVLNGVRNAVEASREGGVVRLNAWVERGGGARREDGVVVGGGLLVIEVRDSGVGLTDEALCRAFECGWSGKAGGAGVGLALSREMVDGLGGEVRLFRESTSGETVFRVEVPAGAGLRGGGDLGRRVG